jgi:stage V sporulation protein G
VEITQVRVFPVDEDKLKAFVSIVIDDCFVVSDIKIIEGANGLFISMPSKKRRNGTFRDIAHPLNNETRGWIEERIVKQYLEVVGGAGEGPRVRTLGDRQEDDGDRPRSGGAGLTDGADDGGHYDLDDGRPAWP